MLDEALLEQILFDLALASRVENLFLDRGVNRQFHADLPRQFLFAAVALGAFEFLEQLLDGAVIVLQQSDRVLGLSAMIGFLLI